VEWKQKLKRVCDWVPNAWVQKIASDRFGLCYYPRSAMTPEELDNFKTEHSWADRDMSKEPGFTKEKVKIIKVNCEYTLYCTPDVRLLYGCDTLWSCLFLFQ